MTRAIVTGAAGFLGSHLCDRLLAEGWDVVGVDSLLTGQRDNLTSAFRSPSFRFEEADVTLSIPVEGPVDYVVHMASPASPVTYTRYPLETLRVGAFGTHLALQTALDLGATFLLASTSEVYGDPAIHPQPETYWGNVNPIGPRSMYDEAKRFAEALATAYRRTNGLPVRIVRIFNTYGPRLHRQDGRAVPTFIDQALRGEPVTVHGDGDQTRSLCYVDDLIEGIFLLMTSNHEGPMNIGNPEEVTMTELAEMIRALAGSASEVRFVERPLDDPQRRCPDITLAERVLGWEPTVSLQEGLATTLAWARGAWGSTA